MAGNTLGAFVQVVAVAFGIGPLVERSVALCTVMKLAGAGYLMFLGVQAIRHRRSLATALGAQVERKTTARIVLDGFTVGATNPKVIVFFAAMLPQFVDRQTGDVPTQIIVLGAIFAAIALLSDSTWALAAGDGTRVARPVTPATGAHRWRRRPGDDRRQRTAGVHRSQRLTDF